MSVVGAVERDLKQLPSHLAQSTLASTALALARELDDPDNSATSKSMCARSLLDTLDRLDLLKPATDDEDDIDDLSAKRAARRAAAAS